MLIYSNHIGTVLDTMLLYTFAFDKQNSKTYADVGVLSFSTDLLVSDSVNYWLKYWPHQAKCMEKGSKGTI